VIINVMRRILQSAKCRSHQLAAGSAAAFAALAASAIARSASDVTPAEHAHQPVHRFTPSGLPPCRQPWTNVAAPASPAPLPRLGAVAEHRTHKEFELLRQPIPVSGASLPAHLLGANVRCMLGWCRLAIARAYSFGLYINDDALVGAVQASEAAAKERKQAADGVTGPPAPPVHADSKAAPDSLSQVLDWLTTRHLQHTANECSGGAVSAATATAGSPAMSPARGSTAAAGSSAAGAPELSLVLVMARDINGEHLAHGFKNSIINRLPGVEKRLRPAGGGSSPSTGTTGDAAAAESTGLALPDAAALKAAALASGRANLERDLDAERLPLLPPAAAAVAAATGAAASAPASASAPSAATPLAQVHAFAAAFNGLTFREGEEIVFTWQPAQGRVVTAFRQAPPSQQQQQPQPAAPAGAVTAAPPPAALPPVPPSRDLQTRVMDAASLASPLLARTLFEVYCGAASSNPVSWRAKATFEANWGAIADPRNGILVVDEQSPPALPQAQAGAGGRASAPTVAAAAAVAAAAGAGGSAPSERASELLGQLRGWAKRTLAGDGIPSAAAASAGSAVAALPGRAAAAVVVPPPAVEFSPCLAVREELLAAAVRREHTARSK